MGEIIIGGNRKYLEKFFKPIEGISKYHYFTFDKIKSNLAG